MIHEDIKYLEHCLTRIEEVCQSLGITLNKKKTHIIPIQKGITFLKTKFILTETGRVLRKMSRASIRAMKRKLYIFRKWVDSGKFSLVHIGDILTLSGIYSASTNAVVMDLSKAIGGSFGAAVDAKVNNAVIYSDSTGTYIDVTFSKAVKVSSLSAVRSIGKLGEDSAAAVLTDGDMVLHITLGANATITSVDNIINLKDLGVTDALTGKTVQDIDSIPVKGTVIPLVKSAEAVDGGHIVITFSAPTKGTASLSSLVSLLGTGASAAWSDNNTVLDITLGTDYTITPNGYLVLNDMGITGFYGGNAVTGQCKLNGSFTSDSVEVSSIIASSEDVSNETAAAGDKITIKFSANTNAVLGSVSNLNDILEIGELVERAGNDEYTATLAQLLGTDASASWISYDELVITLGADPEIVVGDALKVKNISFANNRGIIDSSKNNIIEGSFDGRDINIGDVAITRTSGNSGDWRVTANISRVKNPDSIPTVVCVARNSSNGIVGIYRITYELNYSADASVVFDIPSGYDATKATIYVFEGELSDWTTATQVLANPVSAEYSAAE